MTEVELCADCKKPLSPERAKDFEVCGKCFGERADRWARGELKPKES